MFTVLLIPMAVMAMILLNPVCSRAQMPDRHMEGHMGDGMGNSMKTAEDKNAKKNHAAGAWHIKEAEAAGVKVKVTYRNPGKSNAPVFEVALDTHSVDLDQYSLSEVAVLRDDSGREFKAAQVSAAGSGHHREALLEFKDADVSTLKSVELVVKGVAGVDERVFRFETVKRPAK
ncbi:MAG: hypothetical protein HZB82_07455 [Deltaproteobacteria bacterium]|nr:hypothetical protein [Deltaproteobacteria bacterium]